MTEEKKLVVVIVEDEPGVLRALVRILPCYSVVPFENPQDALAYIEAGSACDALITDMTLPDMCGESLYERIVAVRPALARRTIFMTGGDPDAEREAFLAAHPDRLLLKPFTAEVVNESIHKVTWVKEA